jgi:hypothetical protein
MSNKTKTATATATEVLSIQDKKFIDIEMVDVMSQAHNAGLKRSELVFQVANSTKKLIGKDCTKTRWELIFSDFENRLVNTKQILPATAKNYSKEVVAILKADGIEKPKSTNRTAIAMQNKKAQADNLANKYAHESIENLTARLTQLIGQTDANAVKEFKEVSSVVVKKTNEKRKLDEQNETQAQKDFKSDYTTWFNSLFKTEQGKKELIAMRTNKEVRAVIAKVLN